MTKKNTFKFKTFYNAFSSHFQSSNDVLTLNYKTMKNIETWSSLSKFFFSYLYLELNLSFNDRYDFLNFVENNKTQIKLELNYILTLIDINPPIGIVNEDFKNI